MKAILKNVRSQEGITLLETMIAGALLAMFAMTTMEMILQQKKQIDYVDQAMQTQEASDDVGGTIGNPAACNETFAGKKQNDIIEQVITADNNGTRVVFQAETAANGSKVSGKIISKWGKAQLERIQIANIENASFGSKVKVNIITVRRSSKKGNVLEKRRMKTVSFYANVHNNGTITDCIGNAGTQSQIAATCMQLGGQMNANGNCLFNGQRLNNLLEKVQQNQVNMASLIAKLEEEVQKNRSMILNNNKRARCDLAGGAWNQAQGTCNMIPAIAKACNGLGGMKNGGSCENVGQNQCQLLGGSWNNDACTFSAEVIKGNGNGKVAQK